VFPLFHLLLPTQDSADQIRMFFPPETGTASESAEDSKAAEAADAAETEEAKAVAAELPDVPKEDPKPAE
jgi:hypothetical protein